MSISPGWGGGRGIRLRSTARPGVPLRVVVFTALRRRKCAQSPGHRTIESPDQYTRLPGIRGCQAIDVYGKTIGARNRTIALMTKNAITSSMTPYRIIAVMGMYPELMRYGVML